MSGRNNMQALRTDDDDDDRTAMHPSRARRGTSLWKNPATYSIGIAVMALIGTVAAMAMASGSLGLSARVSRTEQRTAEDSEKIGTLQSEFSALKGGNGGGRPVNVPPPFVDIPEETVDRVLHQVGTPLELNYDTVLNINSGVGSVGLHPTLHTSADNKTRVIYVGRTTNSRCASVFNPPSALPLYDAGFHAINVTDPLHPSFATFVNGPFGTSVNGMFTIEHFNTPYFTGTVLVVIYAVCRIDNPQGIILYNVNDPLNPVALSPLFGDNTGLGTSAQCRFASLFHTHNLPIAWSTGGTAKLVVRDVCDRDANFRPSRDLFDITNPAAPYLERSFEDRGLAGEFVYNIPVAPVPYADSIWTSLGVDMIDGKPLALSSFGYAGWGVVDVSNSSRFSLVKQSVWSDRDPVLPAQLTVGNALCAAYSHDKSVVFAVHSNNGFNPTFLSIADGPHTGYTSQVAESAQNQKRLASVGARVCGRPIYLGYGCPTSTPLIPRASLPALADAGDIYFAVLQRGPVLDPNAPEPICGYLNKMDAAAAAGYNATLFPNHHDGSKPPNTADVIVGSAALGPAQYPYTMAFTTSHAAMHYMFNSLPVDITIPYPLTGSLESSEPLFGAIGNRICIDAPTFRGGYGYIRTLNATTMTDLAYYHPVESFNRRLTPRGALQWTFSASGCPVAHPTKPSLVAQSFPGVGTKFLSHGGREVGTDDSNNCGLTEVASIIPRDERTGAVLQLGAPIFAPSEDGRIYALSMDLNTRRLVTHYVPDNIV